MTQPSNFVGVAGYGSQHPAPSQTQGPPASYGLPRSVPTLTVYAGLESNLNEANLNAEASALCAGFAEGVCLRPPPAVRPGRTPQLWELGPGDCCPMRGRPDRSRQLRFRIESSASPAPGRYLLLPVAGAANRFSLLPG